MSVPLELAGGVVLVAALGWLMRRDPRIFPVLAVFALPFRLPISADGRTVNLLIPLYVVVGAGVLALLVPQLPRLAGLRGARGGGAGAGRPRLILLDWLLLGTVALYAVQASYSSDHAKALENLAFFYVPFGLLYALLRQVRWTRELLLVCLGVAVAEAIVFAGVGFVEYQRHELLLNPKVVAANQFDNYFRVNSLFFDPSVYGRFLALVMLAVTTVVLWNRGRREVWVGAGVLLWLWGGLITSFSQTSIAALLLGLAVLAAWRWSVRATVYVAGALVAVAVVVVLAAPPGLHIGLSGSGGSANNATSGRAKLVTRGLSLFADRPLAGYGSGSFATEYRAQNDVTSENATSASHTIPITVAAEQGIVGLALYVVLLVVAFATLFGEAGRSPPRIALAACFAALVLHTWTYADFLEDPMTWLLLGVGAALAPAARGEGESEAVGGGAGSRLGRGRAAASGGRGGAGETPADPASGRPAATI